MPPPSSGSPKAWRPQGYSASSHSPTCTLPPPPGLMTNHVCDRGRRTHCQMCDEKPACRKLPSGDYDWLGHPEQPPCQRCCVYRMLHVFSQSALEDYVLRGRALPLGDCNSAPCLPPASNNTCCKCAAIIAWLSGSGFWARRHQADLPARQRWV